VITQVVFHTSIRSYLREKKRKTFIGYRLSTWFSCYLPSIRGVENSAHFYSQGFCFWNAFRQAGWSAYSGWSSPRKPNQNPARLRMSYWEFVKIHSILSNCIRHSNICWVVLHRWPVKDLRLFQWRTVTPCSHKSLYKRHQFVTRKRYFAQGSFFRLFEWVSE